MEKAGHYRSFYEIAKKITNPEARLAFYDAIDAYRFEDILPENLPLEADIAFTAIKPIIDADRNRKQGGAPAGNQNARKNNVENNPKTTENNLKQPVDLNETNNVKENVNVNVNENDNTHKEKESACVPLYIPEIKKINHEAYKELEEQVCATIQLHNQEQKDPKNRLAINPMPAFRMREGRDLIQVLEQGYTPANILNALNNYLSARKAGTWKSSFTFSAFCKQITEYLPEFYSYEKVKNKKDYTPEQIDALAQNYRSKMLDQQDKDFDVAVFWYHRKDWVELGMPDGAEYNKLQAQWVKDDAEKEVEYGTR